MKTPENIIPIGTASDTKYDSLVSLMFKFKPENPNYDIEEVLCEHGCVKPTHLMTSPATLILDDKDSPYNLYQFIINNIIKNKTGDIYSIDIKNVYDHKDNEFVFDSYSETLKCLKGIERTMENRINHKENPLDRVNVTFSLKNDTMYTLVNSQGESMKILGANLHKFIGEDSNWILKIENGYLENLKIIKEDVISYDPIFVFIKDCENIFKDNISDKQERKYAKNIVKCIENIANNGMDAKIFLFLESKDKDLEIPENIRIDIRLFTNKETNCIVQDKNNKFEVTLFDDE